MEIKSFEREGKGVRNGLIEDEEETQNQIYTKKIFLTKLKSLLNHYMKT